MKYLNKLTTATIGIDSRDAEKIAVDAGGPEVAIMRVYGKVNRATPKDGDLGPYIVFEGEFEGVNLITGEKGRSDKLIVPKLAETCFNEVYQKGVAERASQTDADGKQPKDGMIFVAIAGDITVAENKSNKGGWKMKYGVAPLIDAVGEDDLTRLANSFPAPKMLSAPETAETPEQPAKKGKK